ncbi:hypothetical protein WN51_02263 [Melipona quadrifasciata]|uniref:Uncharacterized protein n=1 Tax=Melipona quadrifasciata TaxID=166423 RepID=A0A0M8ZW89_9HYME|nr:hypothetical protein WN51_02263 [Melipona quadrifasciata]
MKKQKLTGSMKKYKKKKRNKNEKTEIDGFESRIALWNECNKSKPGTKEETEEGSTYDTYPSTSGNKCVTWDLKRQGRSTIRNVSQTYFQLSPCCRKGIRSSGYHAAEGKRVQASGDREDDGGSEAEEGFAWRKNDDESTQKAKGENENVPRNSLGTCSETPSGEGQAALHAASSYRSIIRRDARD